jgi:hypothetical protein
VGRPAERTLIEEYCDATLEETKREAFSQEGTIQEDETYFGYGHEIVHSKSFNEIPTTKNPIAGIDESV